MGAIFGCIGRFDEKDIENMSVSLRARSRESSIVYRFPQGFMGYYPTVPEQEPLCTDNAKACETIIVLDGYLGKNAEQSIHKSIQILSCSDEARFSSLCGLFSAGLWRKETETLYLLRDPSGSYPLYAAITPEATLFASSPASILSTGKVARQLNLQAVSHYLSMICPPDPITIYENIMAIRPGHYLKVFFQQHQLHRFWHPAWSIQSDHSISDLDKCRQLRSALEQSVTDAIPKNPEHTGFFLSGGTDTSSIVALAAQAGINPIHTFTIGYDGMGDGYDDYNEFEYASIVSRRFSTHHHETRITPAFLIDSLPKIITHLDQPSGDAINSYLVSSTLPESIRIVLTGTGGDEIFIGSHWYKHQHRLIERTQKWMTLPEWMRQFALSVSNAFPSNFISSKILALNALADGVQAQYRHIKFLFTELEKRELFNSGIWDSITGIARSADIVDMYDRYQAKSDPVNRMAALLFQHEVSNLQLRDVDAMCHARQIEARSPLVDRRVLEVLAGTPGFIKAPEGKLRYLMFSALDDVLPHETRTRRKMSFIVPMDLWARRELKKAICYLLSPEVIKRRGLFQPEAVDKVKKDYYDRNKERHPFKIWLLALLELWCRFHIDQPLNSSPPERLDDLL